MIKIFTLDPGSLNSIDNISELIESFGIDKFRLIWKYPSKWNNLVREAFKSNLKPKERRRAYIKLAKLKRSIIDIPSSTIGDEESITTLTWIIKAVEFFQSHNHDGIISNKNPNNVDFICSIEMLDDWPQFCNTDCYQIRRDPEVMSKGISPLLYSCAEIHFVDPYFEFVNERHIRSFIEFTKEIFSSYRTIEISEVCYHTNSTALSENISSKLQESLAEFFPDKVTLKIIRWPERTLHNRFVLTNLGGINFGIGLDDSDDSNSIDYDDITPIPAAACRTKSPNNFQPFMDYNKHEDYEEIIELSK